MTIDVQDIALVPSREFTDIMGKRLRKVKQIPEWNKLAEWNQMDLVISRSPVAIGQDELGRVKHLGLTAGARTYTQAAGDHVCMRILSQSAEPTLELLI